MAMIRRALTFTVLSTATICTAGGMASAGSAPSRDPAVQMINLDHGTVVVYEDGRVYRRTDTSDWYTPDGFTAAAGLRPSMAPPAPPGAYEWASLSDAALDDLVDQIAELGLLDDDLDFGDPMITDSPSSDLVVSIDGEVTEHDVYAPGYDDGLTDEQQANRAAYDELRSTLFVLEDTFGDELSKFAPYVPDEWVVGTGMYWADDVQRPWPLADDPVDGECVTLPNGDTDTATGGYLFDGDIVVADAALPNDPRC